MANNSSGGTYGVMPRRREFATADGLRLVADTAGASESPAIILMHGGGQTRHSWSGAVGALADAGYFVVNYDARGHGESDWSSDGIYNYHRRAADLLSIVRECQTPCALIGASMGGITALQAVSDGYEPGALVLVDIVPQPEPDGIRRIREFMIRYSNGFANAEEAVSAVAAYNPNRPRPTTARGLMRNLRAGAGGRLYWHWDPRILSDTMDEDMARRDRLFERMSFNPQVPTLLVRGLLSEVVSDANVAEFRRALPTIEVVNIAKAGHMVAGDDNDDFNKAAIDYLLRTFPPRLSRIAVD